MRRELNELEYFTWCVGEPYNLVVAVRLRGAVRAEALREALDKAQRRHPLLKVAIEPGPEHVPWFSSDGVGAIPLAVIDGAAPEDLQRVVEAELRAPFGLREAASPRSPLLRATLLVPRDAAASTALVLTAQHVVADGLSMVFLVRDLIRFLEEPGAPVEVLDAAADPADVLPGQVRRRVPHSPLRFRVAHGLARAWVRLRFGRATRPSPARAQRHASWVLTAEQTRRLRERCRREGVSVQSAVCAAMAPEFPFIQMPVDLRSRLGRTVGEAVGFFVGTALVEPRLRAGLGFWDGARRFQRRLRRALRDPFRIYTLFSKAVRPEAVRELLALLVTIAARQRPFSVTNLGVLDRGGSQLQGRRLKLESVFGAVSSVVDASVLTVYTLEDRMHLHVLANEPDPSGTAIRDDVARGVRRLVEAVG